MFQSPFGLAVVNDIIIVSEFAGNRVQILNSRHLSSERILGTGVTGSSSQQFNGPFGIAIWKHELYITDYHNHRVQVWDYEAGTYTRSICATAGGSMYERKKYGTVGVVCTDDDAFILEYDKRRISVWDRASRDRDANKCKRLLKPGGNDVLNPGWQSDLFMSKNDGLLYVSDYHNYAIKALRPTDGEVMRKIGDQKAKHPAGIIIGRDYIYVALSDPHCIAVFEFKSGEMMKSWGSNGKEDGQFQYPMDLAMTVDETELIVADYNNQRLQFFR